MSQVSRSILLLCLLAIFHFSSAATAHAEGFTQPADARQSTTPWKAVAAQHLAGLPGVRDKEKGTLDLSAGALTFRTRSGEVVIPFSSVVAVGVGNQRVELWGTKGRLLRMVIPDGGGLLIAAVAHHRVDMLTVEFEDERGGYHAAVFTLSEEAAEQAMAKLTALSVERAETAANTCDGGAVHPRTVRVLEPEWKGVDVPAAYRALVYEKLLERMRKVKGVDRVYRDGERDPENGCAAYTVALSATGFKEGSQVQRAATGPMGMFLGTTQLKFDVRIAPAAGPDHHDTATATVRGETESLKVSDSVAKKAAKSFEKLTTRKGGA